MSRKSPSPSLTPSFAQLTEFPVSPDAVSFEASLCSENPFFRDGLRERGPALRHAFSGTSLVGSNGFSVSYSRIFRVVFTDFPLAGSFGADGLSVPRFQVGLSALPMSSQRGA